jgi:type IV pilus assembly protein PilB
MVMARKPIGQILKEMKIISEFDIQNALKAQKDKGGVFGKLLIDQNLITADDLTKGLALQSGMEFVELEKLEISAELLDMVDSNTADTLCVLPLHHDKESNTLTVAIHDPSDLGVLDSLRFSLPKISSFKAAVASEDSIRSAIDRYYHQKGESMNSVLASMGEGKGDLAKGRENIDVGQLEKDANAAPVVKLLNMILLQAVRDRGSDIHLEPFEHEFKVRYRVDGVLYEMMPPPIQLARAVISRVKVMSNLDIAETRLPRTGASSSTSAGTPSTSASPRSPPCTARAS